MKLRALAAAALLAASVVPVYAAPPPKTVGFMGFINLTNGVVPTADFDVYLSLYTAPTGGTAVWTEHQEVSATKGLFSTALGVYTPLTGVDFSQAFFVGIRLGNETMELTPRIPLQGVPYAMFAQNVAANSIGSSQIANEEASLAKMTNGVIQNSGGGIAIGRAPDKGHKFYVEGDSYLFGDIRLHAYAGDNTTGTAFIQGRDDSGSTDIGLDFRTQKAGGVIESMYLTPGGSVGLGTFAPTAKLDVRGDIAFGNNGQYHAVAVPAAMRIVAGIYNATLGINATGTGYSVVKNKTGDYTITFSPAFTSPPVVTVSPINSTNLTSVIYAESSASCSVAFYDKNSVPADPAYFNFIAIGPQ